MSRQLDLINRARDRAGFDSYAQLAERLGVTTATMSQWCTGKVPLSDSRIEEIARIAGENAGFWAIAMKVERTKSASLRRSMETFLKVGGVFAVMLLANPSSLGDAPIFPTNGSGHSVHYAKFWRCCATLDGTYPAYVIQPRNVSAA